MKNKIILNLAITALLLTSCATLCKVKPISVTIETDTVQFAESKIPCNKVKDYQLAIEQTIKAIYSDEFKKELDDYIKNNIGDGPHAKAWENVKASEVVKKMREQLNGTYVETYGGIKGLWLNLIFGNIAFDGTEDGPILLNRIPLKNRSASSISNTIAHEVSHRIGLKHPHSSKNLKIAYKEPPYIIGNIIERIVEQKLREAKP